PAYRRACDRQPPDHHPCGGTWWSPDRGGGTLDLALGFGQSRRGCIRRSRCVSPGSRPLVESALWRGHSRLSRRTAGAPGVTCGDGGAAEADAPYRPGARSTTGPGVLPGRRLQRAAVVYLVILAF